MSKKLKPLTIFLSDDELVNFKSHFDEFLNMNCDDKIKEQQQEIERLNNQLDFIKDQNKYIDKLEKMVKERNSIIKEAIEYTKQFTNEKTSSIDEWKNVELVLETILEILKGE